MGAIPFSFYLSGSLRKTWYVCTVYTRGEGEGLLLRMLLLMMLLLLLLRHARHHVCPARSCLPSYLPYRKGMGVTMATLTHSSREEGQRSCLPSYIPLEKGFVEEEG